MALCWRQLSSDSKSLSGLRQPSARGVLWMVAPSTKPFPLLTHSDECRINQQFQERLKRAAISLFHDKIASVVGKDGQLEALCTKGGRRSELDHLFS